MKNEYEVRGELTAIIIESPKYGRLEALISTSSLNKVLSFPNSWNAQYSKANSSFYVQGNTYEKNKQKKIILHRWLTNAPVGMVVDHINHNTLDNTNSNLRVITSAGNQQNKKGANKNSKSGILGVSWYSPNSKWLARVMIKRKAIHVGYFDNLETAEKAVVEARKRYMPYSKEFTA